MPSQYGPAPLSPGYPRGSHGSGHGHHYGPSYSHADDYGGGYGAGHGLYSRSSIFVPTDWNLDGTKYGFVDFIGRVVRQLDHQYASDPGAASDVHHHHQQHPHGGLAGHPYHAGYQPRHGGHGGHGGGHAFYPEASMVSIAHDPHGMFARPGSLSRAQMSHGHARFSSKAVPTTCPRCKRSIMTVVRRRPNALNVAASAGALVAGVFFKLPMALLPLAMLPLQVKALQPKTHYCPRCNYKLGKNVKISLKLD
ncbi:hypothetical protein IWQ56_005782 [Coemansia nantahalensis]|nr:hypothetical protein IWQ56_005782 [Coemansia nantahalensis]KAJ2762814.1 hypothetical protein IWQ57_005709 [Coemansia nantahalensis]